MRFCVISLLLTAAAASVTAVHNNQFRQDDLTAIRAHATPNAMMVNGGLRRKRSPDNSEPNNESHHNRNLSDLRDGSTATVTLASSYRKKEDYDVILNTNFDLLAVAMEEMSLSMNYGAGSIMLTPIASPSCAPASKDCSQDLNDRENNINTYVHSVSSKSALSDPKSPQAKALKYILQNATSINANNVTARAELQTVYGLAVVYYATNGDKWANASNWLVIDDDASGVGYCNWYGVVCDDKGNVISLELSNNKLGGFLPPEIALISTLSIIEIFMNDIGGTLPKEIGTMNFLNTIDIESNMFTGTLFFDELFDTSATLVYLRASGNNFEGTIPSKIQEFTKLQNFWIGNNQFAGTIPTEIGKLKEANEIFLFGNKFKGSIPSEIGLLTKMTWLYLSNNPLQGPIPDELYQLTDLTFVYLTNVGLVGTISSFIGKLSNVQDLYLDGPGNSLTGPIPSEFGSLTHTVNLLLDNNMLTGSVPEGIGKFDNLSFVDVSKNKLTGTIPSGIFDLSNITILYFSNNTFSGTIPDNYSNPPLLKDLWMDGNNLEGTIPSAPAGSFGSLVELLLNENRLSGPVPDSVCDLRLYETRVPEFVSLWADCKPVKNVAQNPCPTGCCTKCTVGKGTS